MSTEQNSPLSYAEQAVVRKLREIADETEKAYLDMHKRMDEASGKVQAFEPYPLEEALLNKRVPVDGSDWDLRNYQVAMEDAWKRSQPVRERNAAVVANNRKLQDRFLALVQNTGIPTTVRRLKPRSRSRWNASNYETVESDWFTGLKLAIPTMDSWPTLHERFESRMREVGAAIQRREAEKAAAARAKAEADEKVRNAAVLLLLSEKYGCQADSWDVGNALLKRCKYMRLAHYLRKNRNDWSDGPDFARQGLDGFSAETPQDQEILRDLCPLVEDWDGDGRVFRDTKWSYDALFGLVNPDLLADYEKWWAVSGEAP